MPPGLASSTPLLESMPLSEALGARVLLKMETNQPSGSFKDRGMAFMCHTLKERGATRRDDAMRAPARWGASTSSA